MTEDELAIVARFARRQLEDVGDEAVWHIGPSAVHFRKRLTAEEQAMLTAQWCSIPAVDIGGDYPTWEPPDA